jgi:hypothetical protein
MKCLTDSREAGVPYPGRRHIHNRPCTQNLYVSSVWPVRSLPLAIYGTCILMRMLPLACSQDSPRQRCEWSAVSNAINMLSGMELPTRRSFTAHLRMPAPQLNVP